MIMLNDDILFEADSCEHHSINIYYVGRAHNK